MYVFVMCMCVTDRYMRVDVCERWKKMFMKRVQWKHLYHGHPFDRQLNYSMRCEMESHTTATHDTPLNTNLHYQ